MNNWTNHSQQIGAWFYSFDFELLHEKNIGEALCRRGITVVPYESRTERHYGILITGTMNDRVCDFIRESSHNGEDRLIVFVIGPENTGYNQTLQIMNHGASDVLDYIHPEDVAERIVERFTRWYAVDVLLQSERVGRYVVGKSGAWLKVLREVIDVAHFSRSSFLITGESGTGKERVARLVHELDGRENKGPFIILDCATLVPELCGSEFFGHEKGAFTGAFASREGAFALANGGTLFLDEIGELSSEMQIKLLRVIQERTYKKIGGNIWNFTDFRLVCATNKHLERAVENGEFRQDLYYRIANWDCRLPSLREREDDILVLARHFLFKHNPKYKETGVVFHSSVKEYLCKRDYPGNIRELEQVVSRIAQRHMGEGPLTIGALSEKDRMGMPGAESSWCDKSFEGKIKKALSQGYSLKDIGHEAENTAIRIALRENDGNTRSASDVLGVSERTIQIRKLANKEKYSA